MTSFFSLSLEENDTKTIESASLVNTGEDFYHPDDLRAIIDHDQAGCLALSDGYYV